MNIEISGAITAAKAALELVNAAIAVRDDGKAKAAAAEMGARLFEITMSALAVQEELAAARRRLSEVEDELSVVKRDAAERETYTLAELRAGAYAYAKKPAQDGDQHQPPYLCQPCYDQGVKAVLRLRPARPAEEAKLVCPTDKAHTIGMGGALPWPKAITSIGRR